MRPLAVLVVSLPLLAQRLSPGVRSGVFITPLLADEGPQHASASRFTVGPCIEIKLWRDTAFGSEFLLRRTDLAASPASARFWASELPATLVYRFHSEPALFVRTGISFNRIFGISGGGECARGPFGERFYCLDGRPVAELRHSGTVGSVVGGGIRVKWKRLRLDPEVRWTHWMDRNFGVRDSAVRSELNQVGFLVGFIF
jgi:hypothetical protein